MGRSELLPPLAHAPQDHALFFRHLVAAPAVLTELVKAFQRAASVEVDPGPYDFVQDAIPYFHGRSCNCGSPGHAGGCGGR